MDSVSAIDAKPVERVEDISARWMTGALTVAGLEGTVVGVSLEPIGTGQMADSFRCHLKFDPADTPLKMPPSVVVKMQAADSLSRQAGAGGGYRAEVRFYTELAPTLSIRTPHCYYAVGPDVDGRFALVLEDMAPAKQGDQIIGCDEREARSALINLAGLHGPRWCDQGLLDVIPRRTVQETDLLAGMVADRTVGFIEHYGTRLSSDDVLILETFGPGCGQWLSGRQECFTPVHGDYRLDNLLFLENPSGDIEVSAVDWQTLDVGLPGRDVGYFLGNSLLTDVRRRSETDLVRAYHEALLSFGVDNYSFEDCFDDYRYGQFQGLMITVLAAVGLSHTDRGDDMFMAMCSRACAAIRDLGSLELL